MKKETVYGGVLAAIIVAFLVASCMRSAKASELEEPCLNPSTSLYTAPANIRRASGRVIKASALAASMAASSPLKAYRKPQKLRRMRGDDYPCEPIRPMETATFESMVVAEAPAEKVPEQSFSPAPPMPLEWSLTTIREDECDCFSAVPFVPVGTFIPSPPIVVTYIPSTFNVTPVDEPPVWLIMIALGPLLYANHRRKGKR